MDLIPSHFKISLPSTANPDAVVTTGNARFTLLTSRLIRMEWSPIGVFEDRASQAFWFRQQPVPDFRVERSNNRLVIDTPDLRLRYTPEEPFAIETLTIELKNSGAIWSFGDADPGNLGGTARTLDEADGPVPLSPGLVSRSGWSLVDDSNSLVFNAVGWLEPRNQPAGQMDLYFFGYGHDYFGCLRDFNRISGSVPMIPRFVLGNWWSRYWEYTQEELTQLMLDFEEHDVPLSVCIIDMDWHITKTGNDCSGWTGYSWNKQLFPDPDRALRFLHEHGLKVALNLHPAEGVHRHETMYQEICEAVGQAPALGEPVEFDITNPRFVEAYFRLLHHPEEERGIDFWWMDWQQGVRTRLSGLDPLWWLNHLHFLDLGRDGNRRSFIFSRWGGLGNHRYPIGFSGDSVISWASLAFQPYFTATASNVNYGWWSHDIGGHFGGIEDSELYTRWVQLGAFLPVLRLHSTKNFYHERRPWGFDAETFVAARSALQLRHMLIPYLYSMVWRFHHDNIPPLMPMYYEYPEREEAYACPNQYRFGDQLIVAPFITPKDPETRMARTVAWLPDGDWFDFSNGQYYAGDGWHALYGTLRDTPVFAKAGAIVPLGPRVGKAGVEMPNHLAVRVFPGDEGEFDLYEDEGNSMDYLQGEFAITPMRQAWSGSKTTLTIGPAEGKLALLPENRQFDLLFRGFTQPESVEVRLNDTIVTVESDFNTDTSTLELYGIMLSPSDQLTVTLTGKDGTDLVNREDARLVNCLKMLHNFRMESWSKADLKKNLPEVIRDPAMLGRYVPVMSESQARALFEVIMGAGIDMTNSTGSPLIVLWNNNEDGKVTHHYALNRLRHMWRYPEPRQSASGPLPRFQVFRPKENFGEGNPWSITVAYSGIPVVKFHKEY